MTFSIEYKGWEFTFDEMPSSEEIEERYRERVERSEVELPVPRPTPLDRTDDPFEDRPLAEGTFALRSCERGRSERVLAEELTALGAVVAVPEPERLSLDRGKPEDLVDLFETETAYGDWNGLVYDATGVEAPEELEQMQAFFRKHLTDLSDCGRVLVVSRPPEGGDGLQSGAAQRAVDGFVRSVAKEIGRTGATSNRLIVERGAEERLSWPLAFLGSERSAYVSAQTIRVGNGSSGGVEVDGREGCLEGATMVVTGVGRGIGRSVAERFAREGGDVLGVDLPDCEGFGDLEEIGVEPVPLDIASDGAAERLAELARGRGGFDVLCHNAGITRDKSLMMMDEADWRQTLAVNLEAPLRTTRRLADDGLLAKEARVIVVSSVTGKTGNVGQANYATSKAGLIGFAEWGDGSLGEEEVTVHGVAPGFIETGINDSLPEKTRNAVRRMNALGQAGKPVDVANAIAFLASPASDCVSDQIVRVCGGALSGA